jgi:osmotically-inducible protein OsmY
MIEIRVEANIVKLTGWVPTVVDKRHAEAIVRSVEGVIEVDNQLDTDVAIQTRVVYALLSDPRTVVSIIRVTTEQGVVTLKGNVDDAEVRDAAEEVAAQQPGVISVVNELDIAPDRDTPKLKGRWFAMMTWSFKTTTPLVDSKE